MVQYDDNLLSVANTVACNNPSKDYLYQKNSKILSVASSPEKLYYINGESGEVALPQGTPFINTTALARTTEAQVVFNALTVNSRYISVEAVHTSAILPENDLRTNIDVTRLLTDYLLLQLSRSYQYIDKMIIGNALGNARQKLTGTGTDATKGHTDVSAADDGVSEIDIGDGLTYDHIIAIYQALVSKNLGQRVYIALPTRVLAPLITSAAQYLGLNSKQDIMSVPYEFLTFMDGKINIIEVQESILDPWTVSTTNVEAVYPDDPTTGATKSNGIAFGDGALKFGAYRPENIGRLEGQQVVVGNGITDSFMKHQIRYDMDSYNSLKYLFTMYFGAARVAPNSLIRIIFNKEVVTAKASFKKGKVRNLNTPEQLKAIALNDAKRANIVSK